MQAYVNDYKVNLFQIAYLEKEQIDKFQSDFRIIADYFRQMQQTGEYVPSAKRFMHPTETLELLSVMTNDRRFVENMHIGNEKEAQNMCDVLDRVEKKGREEGINDTLYELFYMMKKNGMSEENIANLTGKDIQLIRKVLKNNA